MITLFLAVLFGISAIGCAAGGQCGGFWAGIVIAAILLGLRRADVTEAKAYVNWVEHWSRGRPNKKK